jgi:hypothetical protein
MRWSLVIGVGYLSLLLIAFANPVCGDEPVRANAPFASDKAKAHQQAWAQHLKIPVEIKNSIGMKFLLIPPGQFSMGSPPEEEWHRDDERLHRVTLTKPFYMATTEVMQKQWKAVMATDPSFCTGDDLPVETVTWEEAAEFCRKLSRKEGRNGNMPAGRGRPHPFTPARLSAQIRRITTVTILTETAGRANSARQLSRPESSRPTRGAFTICMATSGNGARTGTASIPRVTPRTPRDRQLETAAFFAVAAG